MGLKRKAPSPPPPVMRVREFRLQLQILALKLERVEDECKRLTEVDGSILVALENLLQTIGTERRVMREWDQEEENRRRLRDRNKPVW